MGSSSLFAHQTPSFLFRIINSSPNPTSPPEVSAYSSRCLPISMLCCRHTPGFLLIRVGLCWPVRNSSSLFGFFFHVQNSIGCFHSVHSLQPQWGLFNIIHFFRNTLQTNWASGEKKQSSLIYGTSAPSWPSWVIYTRPALTKMSFTVPMKCTLLSQNDCIWTLICTLWLVKTKLASFYNVNSNVVDTNKARIACFRMITPLSQMAEAKLRLLGTETLILCFQKKASDFFFFFLRWQIIIFQKVHHTLLNVMVFMFSFQSFCKLFVQFLNLIVTYSYARSPFAVTFWK